MAYIAPPATAADCNFTNAEYIPPPAASVDFDLVTFGEQPIVYPPVPGVIASIGTSWGNGVRMRRLPYGIKPNETRIKYTLLPRMAAITRGRYGRAKE